MSAKPASLAGAAPQPDEAAAPASDAGPLLLHATGVAFGPDNGLALIGPAGAGKSSLALALIDAGAQLVGDDRLHVFARGDTLFARPPRGIAGLVEQRGLGVLRLGFLRLTRLRLIIDMGEPESRRLPDPEERSLCGIKLPCLRAPVTGSAALATFPFAVRQYMCGSVMAG